MSAFILCLGRTTQEACQTPYESWNKGVSPLPRGHRRLLRHYVSVSAVASGRVTRGNAGRTNNGLDAAFTGNLFNLPDESQGKRQKEFKGERSIPFCSILMCTHTLPPLEIAVITEMVHALRCWWWYSYEPPIICVYDGLSAQHAGHLSAGFTALAVAPATVKLPPG